MSNEEMQYETILERKKDETRAEQVGKPRAVKITDRTHKSLMSKIKDDIKESYGEWKEDIKISRLTRAFNRYNKRYAKVVEAVNVANEDKEDKENYELASDYADVVKYDRRLAKYGVRLLKHEIKEVTQDVDLTAKQIKSIEKARRLKVPKFLVDKMSGIRKKINKFKEKRAMKKATKEYIKDSLKGALYTKEGLLQEEIDKKVIADLGTKTEEGYSLETLRKFISKDGKTPLFKDNNDEELEKKSKAGTNLPPAAIEATVDKEPKNKTIIQDIMSAFGKKKEEPNESEKKEGAVLVKEENKSEVIEGKVKDNKWDEISKASDSYNERIKSAKSDEERVQITKEYYQELNKIVGNKKQHVGKSKSKKSEVSESKKQDGNNIEPIEVKVEEMKKGDEIKPISSTPTRATQVSLASTTTISFEEVKKLREQMEEDKARIASNNQGIEIFTKRIEELKEQKAELVEQIKKQAESLRSEREQSEAKFSTLQGTAEKLESEVSYLTSDTGAAKK